MGSELVRLGALWEKEDRNGKKYLQGNLGDAMLLIFPNTNKKKDSQPDWSVCVTHGLKHKAKGYVKGGGGAVEGSNDFGGGISSEDVPF